MSALILYGRVVISSKVLVLQRRTHGHHRWMFSHVVHMCVLVGLNDSMSAIYELDGSQSLGLSSSLEQVHSKSYMSLIES